MISMTGCGPVTTSDSVTSSLTQKIIPYHKFELKSPNSASLISHRTDVLGFSPQATHSLKNQMTGISAFYPFPWGQAYCSFGESLISIPHLTSKITLPPQHQTTSSSLGFFVAIFLSCFEQSSLQISPSNGRLGTHSCTQPPLPLRLRSSKGGWVWEEGRDTGYRFWRQHKLRVLTTFIESSCDYRARQKAPWREALFISACHKLHFLWTLSVQLWHNVAKGFKVRVDGSWRGLRQETRKPLRRIIPLPADKK